jgi:solute carrier family 25 protein 44
MMIYNYADKFISGDDKKIIEHLRSSQSKGTLGLRTIKAVYHVDGLSGFYRGFWASSLVYAPSCFVFWPTYYWFQDLLRLAHKDKSFLLVDQAIAATLGGACSTIATNPMEGLSFLSHI